MSEEQVQNKPKLHISIRTLVEFIMRSGDIDNRRAGKADKEAMLAGGRIHRKIQHSMGSEYLAEVPLKIYLEREEFNLLIEGRADGIFPKDGITWIDEIKGVYRDVMKMTEPVPVHLAQAKCYAWIKALEEDAAKIGVRMTYVNLDTEDKHYFDCVYTCEELEEWFDYLTGEYEKWALWETRWAALRNSSIRGVEFPFEYREGQRDLAVSVYRTIAQKKRLFIQAPTGVGKTMSALFPAVKAVGEQKGEKIFYLTAKTITRTAAADAMDILRNQNLRMKSVLLTAKEKMCVCDEVNCNPDYCPRAKGHYDRINDAIYSFLTELTDEEDHPIDSWTRERILEHAEKHEVCPFEFSLDLTLWADTVICDYNYVFDPNVRLKRFFADGAKGGYIFLVDEAHNLVERGREMYSADIWKEDFLELKKLIKTEWPKVARKLDRVNRYMLAIKRETEGVTLQTDIGVLCNALLDLMGEIEKAEERDGPSEHNEEVSDVYLKVRHFLNMYEGMDEDYLIYSQIEDDGKLRLRLYCVETARLLTQCMDQGFSTVLYSATFLPMPYYKHLLGAEDDYAIYARSPFPEEHRGIFIGTDVSSRYTRRSVQEYRRMADYIHEAVHARTGNYMTFFPSYKMLEDVWSIYQTFYGDEDVRLVRQYTGMSEEERESFLNEFKEESEIPLLGFCILGGIFSEGIDLTGEALIGSILIGPGLPQVCGERELLKDFYNERGMDGFNYAYRYPGMNKVLQAAGRVIRTMEDKGIILLLDDRFCREEYRCMFPAEWKRTGLVNYSSVSFELENFWSNFAEK